MTDIRTTEGREELQRQVELLEGCCPWTEDGYRGLCSFVEAVRTARTGLNIAEEMAKHIEHHPMTASGRCTECKRLSRRWQAWREAE